MGGKPQRPKLQGYVDEHLFEAFESYRQQQGLNQSQALQKLLAEFFGFKQPSLPASSADTTLTLFQELSGQLLALDDRLKAVEARLAIDSTSDPAPALAELATELIHESAYRLAGSASGLADESAKGLAAPPDRLVDESASGLADRLAVDADGLASESATRLATLPDRLATESADGLARESADRLAKTESGRGLAADGLAAESASGLAGGAIAATEPSPQAPDEVSDHYSKTLTRQELAELKGVTAEAVRLREKKGIKRPKEIKGTLKEWGYEVVPESSPRRYRKI